MRVERFSYKKNMLQQCQYFSHFIRNKEKYHCEFHRTNEFHRTDENYMVQHKRKFNTNVLMNITIVH